MKINLLAAGAFAAALALPLGVCAQQGQPPRRQRTATLPPAKPGSSTWAKRFGNLNLSGDQQQHVQSIINQYSQTHPEGSPRRSDKRIANCATKSWAF